MPRYWVPFGSEISLLEDGFMPDPGDEWSSRYVPEAQALSAIEQRGLVLIGEPGLGKTTALREEYRRVLDWNEGQEEGRELVHWVGLGGTRDPGLLREMIFGSSAFKSWRSNEEGRLHLFLDSLDEARMKVDRVADLLLGGFEEVDFSRLILRLTCRSADRHDGLERTLRQRFGEEHYALRELAPLCKRDVVRLAEDRQLDATAALKQIIDGELQPLAMVPESLGFLLDCFAESGALPGDRAELYQRGLRHLVREPDEDRRHGETALSTGARLAVCARIGAALLLSGRTSVRSDEGVPGPDQTTIAKLAGGSEIDTGAAIEDRVEIDERAIREVLGTGLFTAHGDQGLGFGQATYAEYLCARWLAADSLSAEQVESTLFVEVGDRTRVVPQLREVAAWLARLSAPFRDRLIEVDPKVLLRADPAILDEDGRKLLVDALLAGIRTLELRRWDRSTRTKYAALNHGSLLSQLQAVILDPNDEPFARQVACDVAAECGLRELAPQLTDLSLDDSCDLQVRIAAVAALEDLGDAEHLRRLLPLALDELLFDEDDELRGHALAALWPEHLSASQLFGALRTPKRRDLYGSYKAFLLRRLFEGLEVADLEVALDWAAGLPVEHFPIEALPSVREQLLVAAWPELRSHPELIEPYCAVIVSILQESATLLSSEISKAHPEVFGEQATRRVLLERLIPRVFAGELRAADLYLGHSGLLRSEDAEWLVSRLESEVGKEQERVLAELVRGLLMLGGSQEIVFRGREASPVLRELTVSWFDAVALDSPEANEAREHLAERQRWEREEQEERSEVDIPGGVDQALEQLAGGDQAGFWIATRWLEFDPEQRYAAHYVSDPRSMPGWKLIEPDAQAQFAAAAEGYLLNVEPDPERWFGKQKVYWPAWAGYRALRLLYETDRERLERLGDAIWSRWASIIVGWRRDDSSGEEGEFSDWALEQLNLRDPAAASRWLIRRLDREMRGANGSTVLGRLDRVWNPELEEALLRRARRSGRDPERRVELLRVLLGHGSTEALEHARRLLAPAALRDERRRELARRVAVLLFRERPDGEWRRIWKLIEAGTEFGRELIGALANRESGLPPKLAATEAITLYLWILEQFPREEDPDIEGTHTVSQREQIADWRGRILNMVAMQGTAEAVAALGRLQREVPDLLYARKLMRDAEELVERAEWDPPLPEHLIRLADDHTRRYVRSARDLRRIAFDSLDRAQQKLSGLDSEAGLLWDTQGALRPKGERTIGLWLKKHLQADLAERKIFVGRELEVRPHPKGRMGESIDIQLSAFPKERSPGDSAVNVTIELKGCWNRGLDSEMRDQLYARYLDSEDDQGIYVVAHFAAADWDDSDKRNRGACGRRGLADSIKFFDEQAVEISSEGLADISAFVLDCSLD